MGDINVNTLVKMTTEKPVHSIVSRMESTHIGTNIININAFSSFLLSNGLQFNLVEEVPMVQGNYIGVDAMIKTIIAQEHKAQVSSFNLHFKDCLISIGIESGADLENGIEDILCNIYQHLPYISKFGDCTPEEIHINLEKSRLHKLNACFDTWRLYFPEEIEEFSYHLQNKNVWAIGSQSIAI